MGILPAVLQGPMKVVLLLEDLVLLLHAPGLFHLTFIILRAHRGHGGSCAEEEEKS